MLPNNQVVETNTYQEQFASQRPKHMYNHCEGHRELTTKDALVLNLKSQLHHDGENLFDYTPITFNVIIPEGKQPSLEHFFKKFLSLYYVLNSTKQQILFLNR